MNEIQFVKFSVEDAFRILGNLDDINSVRLNMVSVGLWRCTPVGNWRGLGNLYRKSQGAQKRASTTKSVMAR